jgi:hypothetical protein
MNMLKFTLLIHFICCKVVYIDTFVRVHSYVDVSVYRIMLSSVS